MISNSGHDENGKIHGGKAGDQTGTEWQLRSWYNRPWNVLLHHANEQVREEIALLAERAANNDKIGYDQDQRTTFWKQLEKSNYDPAQIKTACEADCSAGVAAIVKAVGYRLNINALKNVSEDSYTGNLKAVLLKAGFTAVTSKEKLTCDDYAYRGDIWLYEGHHTAINVTNGSKVNKKASRKTVKKGVKGEDALYLQGVLNLLGYTDANGNVLVEDGSCGSKTVQAIMKFQRKNNLDEDGSCGPFTWAAIEKALKAYVPPTTHVKILTDLNCRKGPGTMFGIIKVLKEGAVYSYTKKDGDWIYLLEVAGWVNKKYVREI